MSHKENEDGYDDTLTRLRTAQSINISPEIFEKLYLSPPNKVKGDLRKTFANPTPIALIGFVMSLTPLSCDLMGWRGAGGGGAAGIGGYYFVGGLLMIIGGLLEFFLGNTFPFVVFMSFGGFWFSYGATLTPAFAAAGAYATTADPTGTGSKGFNASLAFYLVAWSMLVFIYLICSLRTNVVFVIVFIALDLTFILLTAAYFDIAQGKFSTAKTLVKGGGYCGFITSMAGWYILFVQMLASVDFPLQLPVGDLSQMIKGASARSAV